jgi:hypothetical protein
MGETPLVQKDEIAVGRTRDARVTRSADQKLALLSDCVGPPAKPTVGTFEEDTNMTRWLAVLLAVAVVGGATKASAQETAPGPGTVVVTIIPGGATFFTEAEENPEAPGFGNYGLGGGVAVHFNRFLAVEGEVSGALGVSQTLQVGASELDGRSPHLLNYSGNLVVSAPTGTSVVPYVTAGVGGLSLFERPVLAVNETQTFLTGNVGGGLSWYAGRWGLRGDYRFIAVQSKDDAPAFFGQEARYGHRVYGGVLLNVGR